MDDGAALAYPTAEALRGGSTAPRSTPAQQRYQYQHQNTPLQTRGRRVAFFQIGRAAVCGPAAAAAAVG
eukprot:12170456-Alexandrium_andersonii.AAC.1